MRSYLATYHLCSDTWWRLDIHVNIGEGLFPFVNRTSLELVLDPLVRNLVHGFPSPAAELAAKYGTLVRSTYSTVLEVPVLRNLQSTRGERR